MSRFCVNLPGKKNICKFQTLPTLFRPNLGTFGHSPNLGSAKHLPEEQQCHPPRCSLFLAVPEKECGGRNNKRDEEVNCFWTLVEWFHDSMIKLAELAVHFFFRKTYGRSLCEIKLIEKAWVPSGPATQVHYVHSANAGPIFFSMPLPAHPCTSNLQIGKKVGGKPAEACENVWIMSSPFILLLTSTSTAEISRLQRACCNLWST